MKQLTLLFLWKIKINFSTEDNKDFFIKIFLLSSDLHIIF
jgi:hypothetical protein